MGTYHEPRPPSGSPADGEHDVWLENGDVKFGHYVAINDTWETDNAIGPHVDEIQITPWRVEDVRVHVKIADGAKFDVIRTPVSDAGPCLGMVEGVTWAGKWPIGRYRVGKIDQNGDPASIVPADEMKIYFSYPMLSHYHGGGFNYNGNVLYRFDESVEAEPYVDGWETLDPDKFEKSSYLSAGAATSSDLGVILYIKNAEPGECILLGIA